MSASLATSSRLGLTARVGIALLGGYAFTWSFVAFGIGVSTAFGADFHIAETAFLLLAFLVYLGLFLWAFAAASFMRVCVVLGGGAALMSAGAWALQRTMLG